MIEKIKSIARSIFLKTSELHDERYNICLVCQYHKTMKVPGTEISHITCGKPITGETITTSEGEQVELCGCVCTQKAKDPLAKCPLKFWEVLDKTNTSIKKTDV